jgi:hypothetical protein
MYRTWHARTSDGALIFIRQISEVGRVPVYEIHRYSGDIGTNPVEEPVPGSIPDELESQEKAIELVRRTWNIESIFEPSKTIQTPIIIDFENVLKANRLLSLNVGLRVEKIVDLIGLPDAVGQSANGGVWWLYGSVQINIQEQRFRSIEVERGDDRFTMIRFSNWFLHRSSSADSVEAELVRRSIKFFRGRIGVSKVIIFPSETSANGIIDFDEQDFIHAFYWGEIGMKIQLDGTQPS